MAPKTLILVLGSLALVVSVARAGVRVGEVPDSDCGAGKVELVGDGELSAADASVRALAFGVLGRSGELAAAAKR